LVCLKPSLLGLPQLASCALSHKWTVTKRKTRHGGTSTATGKPNHANQAFVVEVEPGAISSRFKPYNARLFGSVISSLSPVLLLLLEPKKSSNFEISVLHRQKRFPKRHQSHKLNATQAPRNVCRKSTESPQRYGEAKNVFTTLGLYCSDKKSNPQEHFSSCFCERHCFNLNN